MVGRPVSIKTYSVYFISGISNQNHTKYLGHIFFKRIIAIYAGCLVADCDVF